MRATTVRRAFMTTAVTAPHTPGAKPTKPAVPFTSLGLPPHELSLPLVLPTGQSFRWRPAGSAGGYFGVLGGRLVHVRDGAAGAEWRVIARAPSAPPAATDAAAVADYFRAHLSWSDREAAWAAADPKRYARVAAATRGVRVLRQDPLETLISFILSSNNNITRIASLVEKVAALYGDEILPAGGLRAEVETDPPPRAGALPHADDAWHAFPSLAQLAARADEATLRAAGLGYRARYVVGTAAALAAKDGGGDAWLHALRSVPTAEAVAALTELPGVGPKVAACVALFALDKRDCVPVDTHVWQLAAKFYTPSLRGKTLTPALADRVAAALVAVFGEEAGWAHNALFVAELPITRAALAAAGVKVEAGSDDDESDATATSSRESEEEEDWGPVTPAERAKRRRRT